MPHRYLLRGDAPLEEKTWNLLDSTMMGAAKSFLSGRKMLVIEGPYGYSLKAIPLEDCMGDGGVITSCVLPVDLIQTTFSLSRRDLAAYERDGLYLNADVVACAAIDLARLEDAIIFQGSTGKNGLMTVEGSGTYTLSSWNTVGKAADDIIRAITALDEAGFHGPYTMALNPARYNLLLRRYPQGGTELEHIREMATEGVFKAPIIDSGGVILAAGQQYRSLILGQDMRVGFIGPVAENLEFTISESLALLVREPCAICVLKEKL
ncbi:MAG: bacteriocin family protein [Methanomicrobiales archaeon]|nr:bacteriocin family protein [Methanomicrobiales archaeon]